MLATIHHPITVDRRLELEHAPNWRKRWSLGRWYSFTHMQTQVARRLQRVVTVSENSYKDIVADHKVDPDRMAIVPVGVDPDVFMPLTDVERVPGRLVTTASADVTMKGLKYLLEALAKLRTERDDVHLVVIGKEKPGGPSSKTIDRLGLRDHVEFVTGVLRAPHHRAVLRGPARRRAVALRGLLAARPSRPCPAAARSSPPPAAPSPRSSAPTARPPCSCPPGDSDALAARIAAALDDPDGARAHRPRRPERVQDNWSWRHTAERTVAQYRMRLGQIPPHRGGIH